MDNVTDFRWLSHQNAGRSPLRGSLRPKPHNVSLEARSKRRALLLSLSLSQPHTHTHALSHAHKHTHIRSLSLSIPLSLSSSLPRPLSPSPSVSLAHAHSLSLTTPDHAAGSSGGVEPLRGNDRVRQVSPHAPSLSLSRLFASLSLGTLTLSRRSDSFYRQPRFHRQDL